MSECDYIKSDKVCMIIEILTLDSHTNLNCTGARFPLFLFNLLQY